MQSGMTRNILSWGIGHTYMSNVNTQEGIAGRNTYQDCMLGTSQVSGNTQKSQGSINITVGHRSFADATDGLRVES